LLLFFEYIIFNQSNYSKSIKSMKRYNSTGSSIPNLNVHTLFYTYILLMNNINYKRKRAPQLYIL
jgi:hypothetical protein